jgi:hypothetical protein
MLVVEELDDRLPRIAVVHVVTETGGVNNGEADWPMLEREPDSCIRTHLYL